MVNVFNSANGPQLRNMLVESILFDSIIIGIVVIVVATHTPPPVVEGDEAEVETDDEPGVGVGVGVVVGVAAHEELLTVVLLKVIAPVCATTLPVSVAPPPGKVVETADNTVPTIVVVPLNVAEESTFQKTLQA